MPCECPHGKPPDTCLSCKWQNFTQKEKKDTHWRELLALTPRGGETPWDELVERVESLERTAWRLEATITEAVARIDGLRGRVTLPQTTAKPPAWLYVRGEMAMCEAAGRCLVVGRSRHCYPHVPVHGCDKERLACWAEDGGGAYRCVTKEG